MPEALANLAGLVQQGGPVGWLLALLCLAMWTVAGLRLTVLLGLEHEPDRW